MKRRKQKSSGWRPSDKRRPWAETKARILAAQKADARREGDASGQWRACPVARCQRQRRCAGDPYRCKKERGAQAANRNAPAAPPAPAADAAPRFAISAKEAAAIIKADVQAHIAAHGDDPDGVLRGGF